MDESTYEELGLSKNESKVYQILVEFGKLSSVEISAKSSVPYGKIYNVLNSLINKGLVKIVPEKNKRFVATSPEHLLEYIKKKEEKLEKAKAIAKRLKQFYETKEKEAVTLGYGKKAFYKMLKEHRKPIKTDYAIRWTSEFNPEWVREVIKEKRKGVDWKSLVRYDEETKKNVKNWGSIHKNIKKFDNEGVAISIMDNKEVLISLIKSNTTMIIKDVPFVKVMKQLFLDSYKNAEEIK